MYDETDKCKCGWLFPREIAHKVHLRNVTADERTSAVEITTSVMCPVCQAWNELNVDYENHFMRQEGN